MQLLFTILTLKTNMIDPFRFIKITLKYLTFFIFFYFLGNDINAQNPASSCTNLDFESCDFSGWELFSGNVPGTAPSSFTGETPVLPSVHQFIVSGGYDSLLLSSTPVSYLPRVFPGGGSCSVLLGDSSVGGAKGSRIRQTFLVDSGNSTIAYSYAVILQNPTGHAINETPYFSVRMLDADSNNIPCGFLDEIGILPSSGGDPSFISVTYNGETLLFSDWQTQFVSLGNYINQSITVEFTSGDCSQGGHFGYAYIDGACMVKDMENGITVTYGSNCGFPANLHAISGVAGYLWNTGDTTRDISINAGGTYTVTVTSTSGCSAVFTKVFNGLSVKVDQEATICTGDSLFLQGSYQSSQGTYFDTLQTSDGCDSIIETLLIIDPGVVSFDTVAICNGSNYSFGSQILSAPGNYSEVFNSAMDCDSTVFLSLSVSDTFVTLIAAVICSGTEYTFGNQQLTVAGTYFDSLVTGSGCDSIVILDLLVYDNFFSQNQVSICSNDSIFLQGAYQVTPGSYIDSLQTSNGCDSIVITNLSIGQPFSINQSMSICPGDSAFLQGFYQITPGIYYDTLQAVSGCDSIIETVLTVNPSIIISISVTDDHCGLGIGTATATVSGGSGNYNYLWNNGQTDQTAIGLVTGAYWVNITDTNGCTDTASAIVNTDLELAPILITFDANCYGLCDGSAQFIVSGLLVPTEYSWSTGDSTEIAVDMCGGSFSVTATDSLGCSVSETGIIGEPGLLSDVILSTPDSGFSNGSATIFVSGGSTPYSYFWSNGENDQTIDSLTNIMYFVTVSDANGCLLVDSVFVGMPEGVVEFALENTEISIIPNPSASGIFDLWPNREGCKILEITVSNIFGEKLLEIIPASESLNFRLSLSDYPQGVYLFKIETRFQNETERQSIQKIIYR